MMPSLRIIYYSPHPTHDIVSEVGYSTHQRETIHAMRNLGHEVLPVVMGGTEKEVVNEFHSALIDKSKGSGGLKKWIPLSIWNALKDIKLLKHDIKAGKELEKAIVSFKPDLIYERGEYLQDSGVKMAGKYGITHFLEVNSPVVDEMADFEGADFLRFLGHQKERNKLRRTNHVFAISSAMKKYLHDTYKITVPVSVTPNCINPEKDIPAPDEIGRLKSELAAGKTVVGFVGSLFPYHGVDVLIKAFADAHRKHPDLFLLIVGDGAIRKSLMNLANELLPDHCYHFTGKVPHKDVMKYIGVFDIAVMATSNWYGSPIKIFEYGLMGKAIIAPDNGPLRDVMRPDKDGILVQPDSEHLSEAINALILNFEMAGTMGETFRNRILDEFTWQNQVFRILSTPPLSSASNSSETITSSEL